MTQQSQNTSNRVPKTKDSVRHTLLINLNTRNEDKTSQNDVVVIRSFVYSRCTKSNTRRFVLTGVMLTTDIV